MSTACLLLGSAIAEAQTNQIQSTGNVGIGTTSPSGVLEVKKDVSSTVIGAGTYGNVIGSNHDGYELDLVGGIPDAIGSPYANGNMGGQIRLGGSARGDGDVNVIQFLQNGVEKARIHQNGKFGIGTQTPTARLHVVDSSFETARFGTDDDRTHSEVQVRGTLAAWNYAASGESAVGAVDQNHFNNGVNPNWSGVFLSWSGQAHTGKWGSQSSSIPRSKTGTLLGQNVERLAIGTNGMNDIYMFNANGVHFMLNSQGNFGLGTTSPTHKLSVNGTVRAKEVIVETTGWSDYVLAPDYKLPTLAETEQHIIEHGHLPGIPSAAEVEENGVTLGDFQAKLLAKIEELTLHQIAMEKRMKAMEAENQALRSELSTFNRL